MAPPTSESSARGRNDINKDTTTAPRPNNAGVESVAKSGCLGFYASAKTHTENIVESMRRMRRKNEAKRRREKMMDEVRQKYEEMLTASDNASTDKGENVPRRSDL
jgi:hypothetical protein